VEYVERETSQDSINRHERLVLVAVGVPDVDADVRSVGPQSVKVDKSSVDRALGRERQPATVWVELAEDNVAGSVNVEQTVRPVVRRSANIDVLAVTNICTVL